MLRLLVLLLVLANGVYFAWSQDLLRGYGFAPTTQRETYRLAQQVRPEAVSILSAEEAQRLEAAPKGAVKGECLQAGLFSDLQATAVRQSAQAVLPEGSWQMEPATYPARWIIYMGKYPDAQTLAKKRAELASLHLWYEHLTNPALEYGLSLGGFETEAQATRELASLNTHGVKTAHVVLERAELRGFRFKVPAADDALKGRLNELRTALAGKSLRSCG